MMVAVHATGDFPDLQYLSAAWNGVRVFAVTNRQAFSSLLFRDPDAVGVLHCHLAELAPQFVRCMREGNIESSVLVLLRERGTPEHRSQRRAQTLIAGADDVQPEGIDPRELVARLRAIQQRTRSPSGLIDIPSGRFDPSNYTASGSGIVVQFSGKESALLQTLATRPGSCVSKASCMQALYGGRDEAQVKILDVFIHKLRRKLKPICGDRPVIETVWGEGYRFLVDEVAA
ncbi:MAG: response regulator transcription factor [Rhizobiales bacterium]|nr:response regulator transcription factor [Hyphomicrobiales bacterium]